MPDKDKESLEQQKQAQKAFKEAEKNAKRKEREEAEANSMPGYTKAQKNSSRWPSRPRRSRTRRRTAK